MDMRQGKVYIGTSGWHYKHWKGTFYPADIKAAGQFAEYLRHFSSVEINNSFYRLPSPETFSTWRKTTPPDFTFAVKGSRFITHMKKLNLDKQGISKFFKSTSKLKEKLGVILFQLPPRWKVNIERLQSFIKVLPKRYRYAFEFREHSWYNDDVYAILRKSNCSFCIYELEYHLSPLEVTADFVYVRLHGPGNKYQGSYPDDALGQWADRCKNWQKQGKDVYFYFDNDQEGYAAFNALTLKKLVTQ
jgi:uncharacterized protein YecE (DUF72 family)